MVWLSVSPVMKVFFYYPKHTHSQMFKDQHDPHSFCCSSNSPLAISLAIFSGSCHPAWVLWWILFIWMSHSGMWCGVLWPWRKRQMFVYLLKKFEESQLLHPFCVFFVHEKWAVSFLDLEAVVTRSFENSQEVRKISPRTDKGFHFLHKFKIGQWGWPRWDGSEMTSWAIEMVATSHTLEHSFCMVWALLSFSCRRHVLILCVMYKHLS